MGTPKKRCLISVDPVPKPPSVFGRYWAGAAISSFGTAITAVAMPVLVIQLLGATPLEVGIVNAAQFLPYAVLGLLAGAYTDRWRRKPVLVWASIGRAVSLAAIPALWMAGVLQIWMLVLLLLAFGACAVFGFAATQSLLPRLVPRSRLILANSRLDQTDAASQTFGPAIGGGLVGILGAPIMIIIDSISYLVEAALVASIRIDEPRSDPKTRNLRREIKEGLQWAYGHRVLGPLAFSTHVWFAANGIAMTALSLLALRSLGLSSFTFGMLLATSGITGLLGATLAPKAGERFGSGRVILVSRVMYPAAWTLAALASIAQEGAVLLFAALALHGLASGLENANEMALRQTLTPDALLGRTNATIRSVNRTAAALGAMTGGAAVGLIGDLATILIVIVLFTVAAGLSGVRPVRTAVA